MSELQPQDHDRIEVHTPEHVEQQVESQQEKIEVRTEKEKQEQIAEIENEVNEQEPVKSNEILSKLNVAEEEKPVPPASSELKKVALSNYLKEIRTSLSGPARQFSKFIHKPTINSVSEAAGKTIVRPSAILFGGIFMFIGSAVYLYATYKTNARYNFLVALFLFFGGFIAGLIIELFYKLFFRRDF
jgi:hypothetical protein